MFFFMINVVLLSHHPIENLRACLASLDEAHRRAGDFELSICIGFEDDREAAVRAGLPAPSSIKFDLVRLSSNLTVPESRNVLLRRGSPADWILYLDDDITVPETYFQEFFRLLQRWPQAEIIGGPNLTPPQQKGLARDSGWLMGTWLNWVCRNRYRQGPEGLRRHFRDFILCNLFVHSRIQPQFKPSLPWGEELGFLRDELERGRHCVYAPGMEVYHRRRETLGEIREQMFRYGRGRGLLLAETSSWGERGLFWGAVELGALLGWPLHLLVGGSYPAENHESSWMNRLRLLALLPRVYRQGVRTGYREGVQTSVREGVRTDDREGRKT